MRTVFPGFYNPTDDDFKKMWETGLFVFDTNVLLDLYRYSEETVDNLISIMDKLKERIWIPYRVAFEYHRRLNDIIQSQAISYTEAIKALSEFNNKFKEKRSHPFLKNDLHEEVDIFCKKFDIELIEKQSLIKKLILENPIKEKLADIIQDRVGKSFTDEELKKIYEEGSIRYANRTPPGYKDLKNKQGNEVYGDLIIWKEILKKSGESDLPIIFVTGDVKEDWFQIVMGMTVSPRPELVEEIKTKKNVLFYIYPTDSFLRYAHELLQIEIKEGTLTEIGDIIKEAKINTMRLEEEDSNSSSDTIDKEISEETAETNDESTESNTPNEGEKSEASV